MSLFECDGYWFIPCDVCRRVPEGRLVKFDVLPLTQCVCVCARVRACVCYGLQMSFLWLLYAWKLGRIGLCAPIHLPTPVSGLSDSTGCGLNPKFNFAVGPTCTESVLNVWTNFRREFKQGRKFTSLYVFK